MLDPVRSAAPMPHDFCLGVRDSHTLHFPRAIPSNFTSPFRPLPILTMGWSPMHHAPTSALTARPWSRHAPPPSAPSMPQQSVPSAQPHTLVPMSQGPGQGNPAQAIVVVVCFTVLGGTARAHKTPAQKRAGFPGTNIEKGSRVAI